MREKGASNRIFFLCVLCRGRSTTFVKFFILLLYFILFMIYYYRKVGKIMAKGKVEFGVENVERGFEVVKALLSEGYEVLITQDEFGNMAIHYNKVDWTNETYTLISFDEIDLLHNAKETKEKDDE